MELTPKAVKELEKLRTELASLESESRIWRERSYTVGEYKLSQMYSKESRKYANKACDKDTKIRKIEASGISTSEENSLKREVMDRDTRFVTVYRDRSLGHTSLQKIGWSKTLGCFVSVDITRYNSFMRNVKGCASLADTNRVSDWKRVTREEVEALLLKGERSICFSEEHIIPINRTADSLYA